MRSLQYLPGLIALAFLGACHHYEGTTSTGIPLAGTHSAVDLAGSAESGLFANATIATLGSFEWDTSPITNKAADILVSIPLALKKHEITKAHAQAQIDSADKAHDLVQKALKACKQDSHGKCTGNEAKARALLEQAKTEIGSQ